MKLREELRVTAERVLTNGGLSVRREEAKMIIIGICSLRARIGSKWWGRDRVFTASVFAKLMQ